MGSRVVSSAAERSGCLAASDSRLPRWCQGLTAPAAGLPANPIGRYDYDMGHLARARADSSAPVETVWRLLSTVNSWPTWSRHKLARLERAGSPTAEGVGAIRVLGLDPGKPSKVNREEVVAFDPPDHFAYVLLSGMPLQGYRADVTLEARPGGGCRITWESRFSTPGWRGWGWALVVRWVVRRWSSDLARGANRAASHADPGGGSGWASTA